MVLSVLSYFFLILDFIETKFEIKRSMSRMGFEPMKEIKRISNLASISSYVFIFKQSNLLTYSTHRMKIFFFLGGSISRQNANRKNRNFSFNCFVVSCFANCLMTYFCDCRKPFFYSRSRIPFSPECFVQQFPEPESTEHFFFFLSPLAHIMLSPRRMQRYINIEEQNTWATSAPAVERRRKGLLKRMNSGRRVPGTEVRSRLEKWKPYGYGRIPSRYGHRLDRSHYPRDPLFWNRTYHGKGALTRTRIYHSIFQSN